MNLEACLPADLQGTSTITRVAAGLSGAGVYKVDSATGAAFVLKISAKNQPLAEWQHKLHGQQAAADAGLAPRIVHIDESRRAVLSEFIVDRSFPALFGTPATRERAIELLGRTLRRVHDLPLPAGASRTSPREFLATTWAAVDGTIALPSFVVDAVQRALSDESRVAEHALVFSHNDVNPSNLVYDGERLLVLDWDTSGANEPYYDLGAISVFLRLDDLSCQRLIAAHNDTEVTDLPADFIRCRRLAAVFCGTTFMRLASFGGVAGSSSETLESAPMLIDLYQRMRAGTLNIASAEGQWLFGLALVKQSYMA